MTDRHVLARHAGWIACSAGVMVLQSVLIIGHRPWLDEWQALQIAVQSPGFADLLHNLRYEGHPPLWYLILRGTARLVPDPVQALPAAALVIALVMQALILFAAPFSRTDRLLIALSEPVLFEFLTVSRSLTLGALLIIVVAASWQRRVLPWLAIALLPLCDALFGMVSLIFVALRLRDDGPRWPAAVWLAGCLAAAWSVIPAHDLVPPIEPGGPARALGNWLAFVATAGLPLQMRGSVLQWSAPVPALLVLPCAIGFLAMAWRELAGCIPDRLGFMLLIGATLLFSMLIYPFSARHMMVPGLVLIALVWRRAAVGGRGPGGWMRTWLALGAGCGLITAGVALARPFDMAPEALALIRHQHAERAAWVVFPQSVAQGIAALGGMRFERLYRHCTEDFIRWDDREEHRPAEYAGFLAALKAKRDADGAYDLVTAFDLDDQPGLLRRIGHVGPGYDGQEWFFYRIGEGMRPAVPHAARCNGPARDLRGV